MGSARHTLDKCKTLADSWAMSTTTEAAKVAKVSVRDIRHESHGRVTRRTFFAALVMTDGTERFCGEECPASKRHEGHNTIKTAIACGTAAARRIGYIARNGEATEGTESAK